MKRAVVFGAGAVGRGFVGASLSQSGWHVTFVDVSADVVSTLSHERSYDQVVVLDDHAAVARIGPVDAVLLSDEEAVTAAVAGADLVATAVGPRNLPGVVASLAQGLATRRQTAAAALDILLCENMHGVAGYVRQLLADELGAGAAAGVGLCAASIGRMIPVPTKLDVELNRVRVEPYAFLPFDASDLRGEPLGVEGFIPVVQGFDAYEDRKLYVHNMGHYMLSLLGQRRGYEFIWQAARDLELRGLVSRAMADAAAALAVSTQLPEGELLSHVDDLLTRFGNRGIDDTVARVARDPERKLQPDDRLLGAARMCARVGVHSPYISLAVALGADALRRAGWTLENVTGLIDQAEGLQVGLTRSLLDALEGELDLVRLVALMDGSFIPSRVA